MANKRPKCEQNRIVPSNAGLIISVIFSKNGIDLNVTLSELDGSDGACLMSSLGFCRDLMPSISSDSLGIGK
jgi:hypothetical protein